MFKGLCFPSMLLLMCSYLLHVYHMLCVVYFLFLTSFYLLLALKAASRTSWLRFDGQIHILSKKEVRFTSLLSEAELNHRPENTFYRSISVEELESLASADSSAALSLSESLENYIYLFYLSQVHWNLAVTLTGIRQNLR